MSVIIYGIIIILFLVHIFWTWNNTNSFETKKSRILYIFIGTLIVLIITYIIFIISKNGISYQNKEIAGAIRNIILLIFVPINGFIILPQIANVIGKIKNDDITSHQLKKRIIFVIAIICIIVIFECSYFKSIQNGIIQIINIK